MKKLTSFHIELNLLDRLRTEAKRRKVSKAWLINEFIREGLADESPEAFRERFLSERNN